MKDGKRWAFWSLCCSMLFVFTSILVLIIETPLFGGNEIMGRDILFLLSLGLASGAIAFGLVGHKRLPRGRFRTSVALNVMVIIVIVIAISVSGMEEFGFRHKYKGALHAPFHHLIRMFCLQEKHYRSHGEYLSTWKPYVEERWYKDWLVSDSYFFDHAIKYHYFLSATKTGFEIHAVPSESSTETSHCYTDENGNPKEEKAIFYYFIDQTGYIRIEIGKPASKTSSILGKTDGEVFPVSRSDFSPVRSK